MVCIQKCVSISLTEYIFSRPSMRGSIA